MQQFKQGESVGERRHFYLHLVDSTDGITPEVGEAGGQPQISKNGDAFVNTDGVLTAVSNGLYYVELLPSTELNTVGAIIVRYSSANTAEFQDVGYVVEHDPYNITLSGNLENLDVAVSTRASQESVSSLQTSVSGIDANIGDPSGDSLDNLTDKIGDASVSIISMLQELPLIPVGYTIQMGGVNTNGCTASASKGMTLIIEEHPAKGPGVIDTIHIRVIESGHFWVGVFYKGDGDEFICRSAADLGELTEGIPNGTVYNIAVNIPVEAGDFLGYYCDGAICCSQTTPPLLRMRRSYVAQNYCYEGAATTYPYIFNTQNVKLYATGASNLGFSDPWATELPDDYVPGQAGHIVGSVISTTVSGINTVVELIKDAHWNKRILTKISDTVYKDELYNDNGNVVIMTHTLTKDGDVETRQ